MKKNIFITVMLLLFTPLIFSACNSKSNISGSFKSLEYIISTNEEVNFYDELSVKGIEKDKVILSTSNENIITPVDEKSFYASSSGRAYVFASYQDKIIAQTEVYVKQRFSLPTKVTLNDENGMVTWEKSYAIVDGEKIVADKYNVSYSLYGESEKTEIKDIENNFFLPVPGSYQVNIVAVSQNKYVDNSESKTLEINYGVMPKAEELKFTPSMKFDQTGSFTWREVDDGIYDIFINGIKLIENLEESVYTYDFTSFTEDEFNFEVVIKDKNGKKKDSSTRIVVKRLESCNLNYSSEEGGYIFSSANPNASKFMLEFTNIVTNEKTLKIYDNNEDAFKETLANCQEGIYEVSLMAIGGYKGDTFYFNSPATQAIKVGKLHLPNVRVNFVGSKMRLTFESDEYIQNYQISYASENFIYDTSRGLIAEFDLASLEPDDYQLKIIALPAIEGNLVREFSFGGQMTNLVVRSDEFIFDFYKLNNMTQLTHTFDNESSILITNVISKANKYYLYINDQKVESSFTLYDSFVTITAGKISNFVPVSGKYTLRVDAFYEVDGVEHSLRSTKEKIIEILPIVSASTSQNNGEFVWNDIQEDCLYSYKLYKTDKEYSISSDNLVLSGTTETSKVPSILEEGYYKIIIASISKDVNEYFDSNAHDNNNVFERNFFVTRTIDEPIVTFEERKGELYLTIVSPRFGGEYKVKVNGTLDGNVILDEVKSTVTYKLDNKLEKEAVYEVEVIACGGKLFDPNIYLDSQPFKLNVTRLALPTFSVKDVISTFDELVGQTIEVQQQEGSSSVHFKLDGTTLSEDSYDLDISDFRKFGTEFNISMIMVADERSGDDYYVNSFERLVNFKRVKAPSLISYSNGKLSWQNGDSIAEKVNISIILKNSQSSNYYHRFFSDSLISEFDLQSLIDQLCEDNEFYSAYRQAEKIQIEIVAYKNGQVEDTYYLYSSKGSTSGGGNTLNIETLSSPTLSFNPTTKILSWNREIENSIYDIYLDNEIFQENYKGVSYSILDILDEFDFQRKITVMARHEEYLKSKISEPLNVKRLATPLNLTINKNGDDYFVSYSIEEDSTHILSALVNGSSNNVDYIEGGNNVSFRPKDFSGNEFVLAIKAKNDSNINYYLDAEEAIFSLIDLRDATFTVTLGAEEISWSKVGQDLFGNNIDPIIYQISIKNGDKTYKLSLENQTKLALDEIESLIGDKLKDSVEIKVQAVVGKTYVLNLKENSPKGYYGKSIESTLTTKKLKSIDEFTVNVVDDESSATELDKKLNATLDISFADVWTDNVTFKVTIGESQTIEIPSSGILSTIYGLNKKDGIYTLSVKQAILNNLSAGETTVKVEVICDGLISSDESGLTLQKFDKTMEAQVTDLGVLQIEDTQNANYLVQIKIGDELFERIIGSERQLDLLTEDLLLNKVKDYTIKILSFDNEGKILPASSVLEIKGYKLEGISNISIDDYGDISFTLFMDNLEDIVFSARRGEQETNFIPIQSETSSNVFKISMIDVLKLFDNELSMPQGEESIDFSVGKLGSIKSDYINLKFKFAIEKTNTILRRTSEKDVDYLLLNYDESDITTTSIRVEINALFDVEDEQNPALTVQKRVTIVKNLPASEVEGYWTDENNFVKAVGSDSALTYSHVFGINLNEILKDVPYGEISVEVSRIAKQDKYYQYNSKQFQIYKLCPIIEDSRDAEIKANFLNIKWEQKDEETDRDVKPTSYIIYFMLSDSEGKEQIVRKITHYGSSFDIRKAGLDPLITYNVYVKAVSNEGDILSSNLNEKAFSTMKFIAPMELEVKSGKLQFKAESFAKTQFIKDIQTFFSEEIHDSQYFTQIFNKSYSSPYYFLPNLLSEFDISLKFTRVENGQQTNKVYSFTTKGYNLFPDIEINGIKDFDYLTEGGKENESYYEILKWYANKYSENYSQEANATKAMVNALSSSSRGIFDNGFLFDDGDGRIIPAGEYIVNAVHTYNQSNVESELSQGIPIYLSGVPEVELKTENKDGKAIYVVDVNTVETMLNGGINEETGETIYNKSTSLRYKMQLRRASDVLSSNRAASTIDIIILFDSSSSMWTISYRGEELNDIISPLDQTNPILGFTINMSALKDEVNKVRENTILINQAYKVDIIVYNQDNGYVINGKSGKFNLLYLDLQSENVHFNNGQFTVDGNSNSSELLIKYRLNSSVERTMTTSFLNGQAVINLPDNGTYSYVILSINGSVSKSTMNIESSSYLIENLHRLSAPALKVQNNSLNIRYSSADIIVGGDVNSDETTIESDLIQFNMANDISLAEDYSGDDRGYYFTSRLTSQQNQPLYVVGALDNENKVKYPSEIKANEFYAYIKGNSGDFVIGDMEGVLEELRGKADVKLEFSSPIYSRPILSSPSTSIKAKMLGSIDRFDIKYGDLLVISEKENAEVVDEENNKADIIYEIKIDYFSEDNFNEGSYLLSATEYYYSEKLSHETEQYFSGLNFNTMYSNFQITITMISAKRLQTSNGSDFSTIEGNYYSIAKAMTFAGEQTFALKGESIISSKMFTRTLTPSLIKNNNGVRKGNINFIIDRSLYFSDNESQDGVDADTAKRITIYADYISNGENKTIALQGKFTFVPSTEIDEADKVRVSFLPDDGQLNDTVRSFTLRIYIYGQNTIVSAPLIIRDVYKLTKMSSNYYDIVLDEGKTGIDFTKYFQEVSIQDNHSCYKIVGVMKTENGDKQFELTNYNSADSKVILIADGTTEVSFWAQDGQSDNETNAKKLLSSDIEMLTTNVTSIEELEIHWNNTLKRFEWNWKEENENKYQFFVSMTIGGVAEEAFVTDNFYCPHNRGIISANSFKIKARLLDENLNLLSIFSEEKIHESSSIKYDLFSGGNGSEKNPYLINSLDDFKNIALRNTNEFFFRLGATIDLDLKDLTFTENGQTKPLFKEFNAHLDGNGHTINVISSLALEMDEFTSSLIGRDNLIFNNYSSIFHTISTNAVVKNVNINYNINYINLNSHSIIFAPLAAFNNGTIDGVIVNSTEIYISGQGAINNVFIGGIVGVNYSKIINCLNSSAFNYSMPAGVDLCFGYSGIALFNANNRGKSGYISNCFNRGDKEVSVARNNALVYMAGITLTNTATISLCGNDSNLFVDALSINISSLTCYFAGITITSSNGTLEYLYNNGLIDTKLNFGTFNSSGIAYQVYSGSINTLVVTRSGQAIIKSCSSVPLDRGTNYAPNNSGTDMSLNVRELEATSISCREGFNLNIVSVGDDFTATITK